MLYRLRILTAGESHGPGLTGILEGFPAGVPLEQQFIEAELARRRLGYGRGGRMRIEKDEVEIQGGVRHGVTLGSPIALWIANRDWKNWRTVMAVEPAAEEIRPVTLPRPGHADLPGMRKFGFNDLRNVLERSSARETAMRVALGAVAKSLLAQVGVFIGSHVINLGGVETSPVEIPDDPRELNNRADTSPVRMLDSAAAKAAMERIDAAARAGDTLGGRFEVIATGLPMGLGSYTHWDRKLDARLAAAFMSINAVKAVSIGAGWESAELPGSQVHDAIEPEAGRTRRPTNRAGGIEGGMSNGQSIVIRAAMKPLPTLKKPLPSVDLATGKAASAHKERSDICALPAAAVIGEAMAALVLADALLEKFGGDSLAELQANLQAHGHYG